MRHMLRFALSAVLVVALGTLPPGSHLIAAAGMPLRVTAPYELVSTTVDGQGARTLTYRATITNTGPAAQTDVTATIAGVPPHTTIVDGTVSFGDVRARRAAKSLDTFTVRVDRHASFAPALLRWSVRTAATNHPPSASAGPDQTVHPAALPLTIQLDSSRSTDPDGDSLSHVWVFRAIPAGSAAVLSDPSAVRPTFVADMFGIYELVVTVDDGHGGVATAGVTISTVNSAPVANPGPDQTVPLGATVRLDGSGSTDVDGDLLHFIWRLMSAPQGSLTALEDADTMTPWFIADKPGTYIIALVVNDGLAESAPRTVTVSTENSRPVAAAGPDQTAHVGALVHLDCSGSSDADGDRLVPSWSMVSAPVSSTATLLDADTMTPTFVTDLVGDYVVQCIVNDGQADSAPDTVTITTTNSRPVASAGSGQSVIVNTPVTLDASGSSDADNDPLVCGWSLTSVPSGSIAVLSDPAAMRPTFVPNVAGSYVAQVICNDGRLDSLPATVTIVVNPRPAPAPSVMVRLHLTAFGPGAITAPPSSALPNGINCPSSQFSCDYMLPQNSQVTLTAQRDPSGLFQGWAGSGCIELHALTCTVTLDMDRSVSAFFANGGATAPAQCRPPVLEGPTELGGLYTVTFHPGKGFTPSGRFELTEEAIVILPAVDSEHQLRTLWFAPSGRLTVEATSVKRGNGGLQGAGLTVGYSSNPEAGTWHATICVESITPGLTEAVGTVLFDVYRP